jgi:hypothetical protein
MDNLISLLLFGVLSLGLPAISYAAGEAPTLPTATAVMHGKITTNPATTPNAVTPTEAAKVVPAYQLYTYYGDRYRDPFITLVGSAALTDLTSDRPPQIASLLLKGIIQDSKGRIALLTSGVSSYLLRGGRLYDGRNHMMKGISGVIKSNSVILIGSDHTVKELKVSVNL